MWYFGVMIGYPNAKINLGLYVVDKREDGFHDIETIMMPVGWCDVLEVKEANKSSMEVFGRTIDGDPKSNLVWKAYESLRKDFSLPDLSIYLQKNIPMGAGLGGGSADGAFMLSMLNEQYGLELSNQQLEAYALELGSDCPFFIKNKPALAEKKGEMLQLLEVDLSRYFIAIIYPAVAVNTGWAYGQITPKRRGVALVQHLSRPINEWEGLLVNDFQDPIVRQHGQIKESLQLLQQNGALYTSLSGSGSAVYGLFTELPNRFDLAQAAQVAPENVFTGPFLIN